MANLPVIQLFTLSGIILLAYIFFRVYQQHKVDSCIRELQQAGAVRVGGFLIDEETYQTQIDNWAANEYIIKTLKFDNRVQQFRQKVIDNNGKVMAIVLIPTKWCVKGYRAHFYSVPDSPGKWWSSKSRVAILARALTEPALGECKIAATRIEPAIA